MLLDEAGLHALDLQKLHFFSQNCLLLIGCIEL
jgi:hypothetical protein